MKSYLLYPDKDYVKTDNKETYSDLWYTTIVNHLCVYDKYIKEIYQFPISLMTTDKNVIYYRQNILRDFIKNREVLVNLYQFIQELLQEFYNDRFELQSKHITESFNATKRISKKLLMALENMNRYYTKYKDLFKSEGLKSYVDRFLNTFSLDYIEKLNQVFLHLEFPKGYYVLGSLDERLELSNLKIYDEISSIKEQKKKLEPTGVQLRNKISMFKTYDVDIKEDKEWKHKKVIENPHAIASAEIDYMHFTDKILLELAPSICNLVNDVVEYLKKSREEMAFYIGAINLYDKLIAKGMPICTPKVSDTTKFMCDGLYDVALALESTNPVVGNTLDKTSMITYISGANQGGKTTFLRSYGQAIIMMQLGLFVAGKAFESNTFTSLHTHFNKEEDKSMESGKLDEELKRLDGIMDNVKRGSLILFNESFQSTSEREGSQIAFDIIRALYEKGVSTMSVSHMYHLFYLLDDYFKNDEVYYLRATRDDSGTRSYALSPSKPLTTAFAMDIYKEIF